MRAVHFVQSDQQRSASKLMTDPQIIQAEKPQRDALIIYAFLSRLGTKCTKNEVLEAVSSSPRDNTLDWASDAVRSYAQKLVTA